MAVAAFKKIWDYLVGENDDGAEDDYESTDAYEYEDEEIQDSNSERVGFWNKKNNAKVVSMPQSQQIRMKILKPTTYDDVDGIIRELKVKNGIVMNLEYVNKDIARRIIDTVSGAVTALDGRIEKVSNAIFVVAPYNYDIINEPISKEKNEGSKIPWIK